MRHSLPPHHITPLPITRRVREPVLGHFTMVSSSSAPTGSLRGCYLSRVLLEVARQHLAQVQDRFVSCSEARGPSPPFVVPHPLNRCHHHHVGLVIAGEDRGTSLAAGALLGQPAID